MKVEKMLNLLEEVIYKAGARVSKQTIKEIKSNLRIEVLARTPLVKIADMTYGGYRDPYFSEVEDGAGGIRSRWILTSLTSGIYEGSIALCEKGWYSGQNRVHPQWVKLSDNFQS